MIGAIYKRTIDIGAGALASRRVNPNHVTAVALVLGLIACAVFLITANAFLFAGLLLLGGYLDTLDGAVARKTHRETRFGGYFDAVSDRVFDSAVLFSLAWRTSHWPICMLMAIGGYSVSYAKARAALEVPVSNLGWPHLMGREERVIGLVLTLSVWAAFPGLRIAGFDLLVWGLGIMTCGMAITAVRRFLYARTLMLKSPSEAPASLLEV